MINIQARVEIWVSRIFGRLIFQPNVPAVKNFRPLGTDIFLSKKLPFPKDSCTLSMSHVTQKVGLTCMLILNTHLCMLSGLKG